jgi:hypothetical protein
LPFMRKCGTKLQSRTGHRRHCNTAHAHCMLGIWGHKHTLRICNTYCFSATAMVGCTNAPHCYVLRTLPVVVIDNIGELLDFYTQTNRTRILYILYVHYSMFRPIFMAIFRYLYSL